MTTLAVSLDGIGALAAALVAAAAPVNERRGLVLAGETGWCIAAARAALAGAGFERTLWLGAADSYPGESLPLAQVDAALGREWDGLVVDAHGGFDPDAFGAAVGTLNGGGLLLLLTPPLDAWPGFRDPQHARIATAPSGPEAVTGRFLARLVRVLRASSAITVVCQGGSLPPVPQAPTASGGGESEPASQHRAATNGCRTPDQAQAVEAIVRVATGHRRRPAVLVADRGRGKSAALGMAAARLLHRGLSRIVVTGPRLTAVEALLRHAREHLPEATAGRGHIRIGAAAVEFVPPDALVLAPRPADLVLVDEAAALPMPVLTKLLGAYARIAFATTVHGYEGTGRGFALRFRRILDRETPGWRELHLATPIRWAAGDPLEAVLFRALLLDAEPAAEAAIRAATPAACRFERLDRAALAEDEGLLCELFGLLVLAHYRTTPLDLRLLLDGPGIEALAARFDGHIVGAALLACEGRLDAPTAREVWLGRRRLRGHLLAQSLAQHLGIEAAPRLAGVRIVRLAVHPAVQGRGIGRRLGVFAAETARRHGADYLGVSFGATPDLVRFWRAAGLLPVRIGVRRETVSAAHALMMLQPLSAAGTRLLGQARERLFAQLPHMLAEPLRDLEPELALAVLQRDEAPIRPELGRPDWQDLLAFAFGQRAYEACMAPVWTLVAAAAMEGEVIGELDPASRALLMAKVLQRRGWAEAARIAGCSGRGEALAALRAAMRRLIQRFADEAIRIEASRLVGTKEAGG